MQKIEKSVIKWKGAAASEGYIKKMENDIKKLDAECPDLDFAIDRMQTIIQ